MRTKRAEMGSGNTASPFSSPSKYVVPMYVAPSATYVKGPSAFSLVNTLNFVTISLWPRRRWVTTAEMGRTSPASMVRYCPGAFVPASHPSRLSSMLVK